MDLKHFLSENKKVIVLYLFWLFINIIVYYFDSDYSLKDDFYPFTPYPLVRTYNLPEFLVYGISPIFFFAIYLVFKKKKIDNK